MILELIGILLALLAIYLFVNNKRPPNYPKGKANEVISRLISALRNKKSSKINSKSRALLNIESCRTFRVPVDWNIATVYVASKEEPPSKTTLREVP